MSAGDAGRRMTIMNYDETWDAVMGGRSPEETILCFDLDDSPDLSEWLGEAVHAALREGLVDLTDSEREEFEIRALADLKAEF
jgi:hypothetical protein